MKALISIFLGTWMLALCGGLQAQTRVVTTSDPVFTRAELDQMLAPIALYPDTVLSHILIAATYPLEVIEAERWTRSNRHLQAEDAVNAAALEGWDPSVAALTAFPDLLGRMSDELEWTQNLGDAFLADEGRVMDAIQHLREKAYASGQLKRMKHVKTHRDNRIIVIEPAVERVVYVPYYDTRLVYGPWWWDRHPPVYWRAPTTYVHVGGFYWGPRIYLGSTFFFSSVHWSERRVVVIDYHHHHHRHPHFYSGRKIAHYHGARRWEHNPVHRRNIVYRSEPVRQRYASHDHSRRFSRDARDNHNDHRRNTHLQREAQTQREESKRNLRNEAQQRHTVPRERQDNIRTTERREQLPHRAPGISREPGQQARLSPPERNTQRAEEIRERLANNRNSDGPRGIERTAERRPPQAAAPERRQEAPARERAELQNRREIPQRVQPQQDADRDWRAERRAQAQEQQDARREQQTRRVEIQPRQERIQPQRAPQHEQRRIEHSRPQRESPRPEREQRRFER